MRNVINRLLSLFVLAVSLAGAVPAAADPVSLLFRNESGLDIEVEYRAGPTEQFGPMEPWNNSTDAWFYTTPAVSERWLMTPEFRISFPARAPEGSLSVPLEPITVTLTFGIRAMFDKMAIEIPIRAIEDVQIAEFKEVEAIGSKDRYAKFILMAQFAAYYRSDFRGETFRNIVKSWFQTQWRYMTSPDHGTPTPLRLDPSLTDAVRLAFPENGDYEAQIRQWSMLFRRSRDFDFASVLDRDRCDAAMMLIDYVAEQTEAYATAASARLFATQQEVEAVEAELRDMREDIAAMKGDLDRCLERRPYYRALRGLQWGGEAPPLR